MFDIAKGVSLPESNRALGLTQALRKMECGDSIVVPGIKLTSVHQCARQARIKITTRKNLDGTATVWRTDSAPAAPLPADSGSAAPPVAASIFGEITPAPKPTHTGPGTFQVYPYGPKIWIDDLSKAPANSIFE